MVHWLVCGAELLVRSVIDLERFLKGNALWGSKTLLLPLSCYIHFLFPVGVFLGRTCWKKG